ncbi:MAG: hypothetical protein ABFR50_00160 [Candidatus Fermentibacteria bacterium]
MSNLRELHTEEKKARLELEKAEKEAQKIRLSIPDLLDSQNAENDEQLNRIAGAAEVEVEKEITELSNDLSGETEDKLSLLTEKDDMLEKAATASLKEYILNSGSTDR